METNYLPNGRFNFTILDNQTLMMRVQHQEIFNPLLYYRVLRTRELKRLGKYKHDTKSFNKLIQKFREWGLVGTAIDNKFKGQLIFPGEELLKTYKKENWKNYNVHGEDVDIVKLHWHIKNASNAISRLTSHNYTNSYINCRGPYYEFIHELDNSQVSLGLRTDVGLEYEQDFFERLKTDAEDGNYDHPVIFTLDEDDWIQQQLLMHFFPDPNEQVKPVFCLIKDRYKSPESYMNAKVITAHGKLKLKELITGLWQRFLPEEPEIENQNQPNGIWKFLKDAIS